MAQAGEPSPGIVTTAPDRETEGDGGVSDRPGSGLAGAPAVVVARVAAPDSAAWDSLIGVLREERQRLAALLTEARARSDAAEVRELEARQDSLEARVARVQADTTSADPATRMLDAFQRGEKTRDVLRGAQ